MARVAETILLTVEKRVETERKWGKGAWGGERERGRETGRARQVASSPVLLATIPPPCEGAHIMARESL